MSAAVLGLAVSASALAVDAVPASAVPSVAHAQIDGSGSSWAANAINQWVADVQSSGLDVVFTSNGSATGRRDFALKTTDFGVSDIGFQGKDPSTGDDDTSDGRPYAYLPVVAGGTSFPYQLRVGGQLVRNLRLSGPTLAKIFTGKITNWDDPAIKTDNNGHGFPSIPIIPVVHSEGSGSTAQFTRYLATEYQQYWHAFSGSSTFTEYWPDSSGSAQVKQNGSDGVMNFLTSKAANGAIGYDEYSYALGQNYPVAKVENSAGYFTLPTQYNVAVALTQAEINTDTSSKDYLLQDLDKVYTYRDIRAYPLSSYSYMIIPTGSKDSRMTTPKRQTLADYLYYSLCQGQKEMGPIGYSPLPVNLVSAGFNQIAQLHKADGKVDLNKESVTTCHNPTFVAGHPTENYLAKIAPKPLSCDRSGQGPCTSASAPGAPASYNKGSSGSSGGSGGSAGSAGGSGGSGGSGGTAGAGSGAAGASGSSGGSGAAAGGTTIDPSTGQVVSTGGSAASGGVVASASDVPLAQSSTVTDVLAPLAAVLLVVALVAPPLLSRRLSRRGNGGSA